MKEVDKTDDNEKDEIVIETAVKVDAVDKEVEAVQEIGDESEEFEEEITVEESAEDADKDLPEEEPKSESN